MERTRRWDGWYATDSDDEWPSVLLMWEMQAARAVPVCEDIGLLAWCDDSRGDR